MIVIIEGYEKQHDGSYRIPNLSAPTYFLLRLLKRHPTRGKCN
jgi:hypothetical protein